MKLMRNQSVQNRTDRQTDISINSNIYEA